jgi:glyoxylase-like metal-dependent hydrolase (beta-lactamase superfamily II)
MTLEDHLGDVIRKARGMSDVSAERAAQAAGLSQTELANLEENGRIAKQFDAAALAKAVGLDAGKLEALAKGWMPSEKNLGTWREFRVFSTHAEGMTVNCYLAWDEVSREAAVFDTGWDAKAVLDTIIQSNLVLRHIFITHSHADHVADLGRIREEFPKARVHSSSKHAPLEQRNRPNDFIHLGSLRITNRDTPGHAADGVTYIIGNWPDDAPHVAIVGDAIFAGSLGRGNDSWELARQKVREQILTLPDETLICPGHGPLTTVAEEKANNPFF